MRTQGSDVTSGATPELRALDVLVGRWRTKGRVTGGSPEEESEIVGTDTYEWLAGGFFMLHWVDVTIGGAEVHTLEVIGYDESAKHYSTRFFDGQGNTGTYIASASDGVWVFSTEGARAYLRVDPELARMEATWERSTEDGAWERWMELEFTKLE
jgi:hypothetical protein